MLTMMKLSGNVANIADYHCNEENYYYSQAGAIEKAVAAKGIESGSLESLDYVKVYGQLCPFFYLAEGDTISENTFANLLEGKDIHGTKRTRQHKVHGYDLTFSAPKTVSIAGLVTDRNPEIIKAHDQVVLEVMEEIEKYYAFAQPESGKNIHTGKMLYATVRDGFSREHDPHIHTHVIVMNLTELDGNIMALRAHEMMTREFNKTWGAIYRAKLATHLKDLGYGITYTRSGEWRLDKIPQEVELEFSKRRQQILLAEAEGIKGMDAWRKTRKNKNHKMQKESIILDWQERIRRFNLKSERDNRARSIEQRRSWAKDASWSIEALQERKGLRGKSTEAAKWQLALRRATEKSATVSKNAVIMEYLTECMRDEGWENVSYSEISGRLAQQVVSGNIIQTYDGRYTSWEMVKADKEYMNFAGAGVKDWNHFSEKNVDETIARAENKYRNSNRKTLSGIQTEAVKKMLVSRTFLTTLQGDAGAGKTTALRSVADHFREKNVEVLGLAMSGTAAKTLGEEAGIRSQTLTSFLSVEEKAELKGKPGRRLLIFDEASMLDSRNAAKLFNTARQNSDRVILVGDVNQLQSIAAGNVFERLVKDAERAGDLITLNENFRQKDEELRKAVSYARQGEMLESLNILESRGDIIEIQDRLDRRSAVARLYDRNTLIITGTVAAKDEINDLIRARLCAKGEINDRNSTIFSVVRENQEGIEYVRQLKLTQNDVITFCKNDYKELDVRNGERGTILSLDNRFIKVRMEDNREITVDMDKYSHIDRGFATTTYKSQGQTWDKAVIDADTSVPSLNDMRNQYVNITRARNAVKIYTDDIEYLKELSEIRTHSRDTLGNCFTPEEVENNLRKVNDRTPAKVVRNNDSGYEREF